MKNFIYTLIFCSLTSFSAFAQVPNVSFGTNALNIVGNENTALGYKSQTNSNSWGNVAVGYYTLYYTTGAFNTAIGTKSLNSNTSGYGNVSLGYESLINNTTGYSNSAIGTNSLRGNINGHNNNALGYNALRANTTGNENNAIGNYSMYAGIGGSYNVALGNYSLRNTTGSKNNAIGHQALTTLTTGYENVAVGHEAGQNITTGIRNILLGSYIETMPQGSNYNIAMGYRVGSINIGDNNIIIGKKISLPAGTSNSMNIGGVLFGSGFQSGLPDPASIVPANGKIGINVIVPTATLDVAGDAKVSGHVIIGLPNALNIPEVLTVNGKVHAQEVIVDMNTGADFVFHPSYNLMPISQVEQYVKTNSHLPEIPSAAEISKNGLSIGEMQNKLLQKIEELTLYVIEQQKEIELLKEKQK